MTSDPHSELRTNVYDLTSRHIHMGRYEDALLLRLEQAATIQGQDGGKSNSAPIPIDAGAIDLLNDIHQTVRDGHVELSGKILDTTLDVMLNDFTETDDPQLIEKFVEITTKCVKEIRRYLDPPPVKRRPLWKPCYDCGTKMIPEEGTGDLRPAVTIRTHDDHGTLLHAQEMDMHCVACGKTWVGHKEMAWPLRVLNGDTPERVKEIAVM